MASRTSRIRNGAVALLFVGSVLCLAFYVLILLFDESLYSRRGSFAFYVTIHESFVRHFPVLDAIDEPEYHSGCGDGNKPPDEAIYYRSRLAIPALSALIQSYVASSGFTPNDDRSFPGACFVKGKKTLYLDFTTAEDGATQLSAKVILGLE